MITAIFSHLRGSVNLKVTTTNNISSTSFGRLVQAKLDEVNAELQLWAEAARVADELHIAGNTKAAAKLHERCEKCEIPSQKDIDHARKSVDAAVEKEEEEKADAEAEALATREKNEEERIKREAEEAEKRVEEEKASTESAKEAAQELKDKLEQTGGIPTTPTGVNITGSTTPDPASAGVQITGGQFDPATKQPQPGTPGHKSDPNEGQDPVDSNPAGGENAKSSKTTAPSHKAAGPKGPKGGGKVIKPKKA